MRIIEDVFFILFIVAIGILICASWLYSAAPALWVDGEIIVAEADVNGITCWTDKEKEAAIAYVQSAGTRPLVVQDFTRDNYEKAVSTSGSRFKNYSDFRAAVTTAENTRR